MAFRLTVRAPEAVPEVIAPRRPEASKRRKPRDSAYALVLVAVDGLAVFLAFLLAFTFRSSVLPKFEYPLRDTVPLDPYLNMPWLLLIWPLVFYYERLYRRGVGPWDEVIRILKAVSFGALLMMGTTFFYQVGDQYSRVVVVGTWLFALITVPALRGYVRTRFLLPYFPVHSLVVTTEHAGEALARRLKVLDSCGYRHLGTLALDMTKHDRQLLTEIHRAIVKHQPEEIMLYPEGMHEDDFRRALRCVESAGCSARIISTLPIVLKLTSVHNFDGLILFDLQHGLEQPANRALKRVIDLVGSILLLIGSLPVFLLLAILIKLDSRGPVFYSQRRLNSMGRTFRCFKFRTMHRDADERLRQWMSSGDERAAEFKVAFKLKHDPRVTRVGKFLRRTSLDELPQLWNVLRGEMSLVGPRPIVPEEIDKYGDDFRYLLMTKGGMTGMWQVSGRTDVNYAERVALDIYYIRNWSVWADFVILLRTVQIIFGKRSGAY